MSMDIDAVIARAAQRRDERREAAQREIEAADRDYEKAVQVLRSTQVLEVLQVLESLGFSPLDSMTRPRSNNAAQLPPQSDHLSNAWLGMRNAIRLYAKQHPENLSVATIRSFITEKYPTKTMEKANNKISDELRRMAAGGELRIVEKGAGNRPSVYAAVPGKLKEVNLAIQKVEAANS